MGKINWGRVLLGGLVAGVVIDLVSYVTNTYVWADQNAEMMKALNVQLGANAIPIFMVSGLVLGIAAVWAYAMARPRCGAGAKTAVITGVGVWLIGGLLPDLGYWAAGILPTRLFCVGTIVGLVTIVAASVAGAALYQEA